MLQKYIKLCIIIGYDILENGISLAAGNKKRAAAIAEPLEYPIV